MKYVSFQKLVIKNFLSIGDEPVIIEFNKGLNIITGINRDKLDRRNGVGKSTVADALYFAVFGNTIRDIKKEFVSNNLTNKTCEVQLFFNVNSSKGNDDFIISRTLNPSRLTILKNGTDKTRDSIANTNEYIEAVLSSTPEVFHNCVVMTVNNTLPFMAKTKGEKRKFIEQVFNLQIFSDMVTCLREDTNKVSKNFDIENAKYVEIQKSIENYEKQKLSRIKEREDKISSIKNKIVNNNNLIQTYNKDLHSIKSLDVSKKEKELEELNKVFESVDEKIKNLIATTTEVATTLKINMDQLSKVGTTNSTCPTCLRPIDLEDKNHITKAKNKLQSNIDEYAKTARVCKKDSENLKAEKQKITESIDSLRREIYNLKVLIENKNHLEVRVNELTELNIDLIENIAHLNEHNDSFNDVLNQTKERLEIVKMEIENLKKSLNLLDVVKFVVSEEGVKSYIVKKILQNFNSKLAFYLKKLDSNSICVFNEYFEEEIINDKGKICSYNNFSGAERKAIDLACLFSFIDMRKAQGNVHYNVSIYDELLDSSLDEKGVNLVLDILKERSEKQKESIFIISHRKESVKAATGEIIFLEKRNGITKRINYVE